uniref:Ig-like domain-containing protein n=1 Tax=Sinocyclocheilus grahami TaxID=75366 RepID=A0A672PD92_SINGR
MHRIDHIDMRKQQAVKVIFKKRFLVTELVQTAVEGETVTINCTYSTTDSFPYLFWYQQEINGYPRYMLKKFPGSGEVDKQFEGRFDANLYTSRTSVPLTIQDVRVSDSAVYYCALKPTVTETHSTLIQKPCK